MLTDVLMHGMKQPPAPREGDLYKEVTIAGKIFRLLYGYYENFEREGPLNDPMPLYPDFIKSKWLELIFLPAIFCWMLMKLPINPIF